MSAGISAALDLKKRCRKPKPGLAFADMRDSHLGWMRDLSYLSFTSQAPSKSYAVPPPALVFTPKALKHCLA